MLEFLCVIAINSNEGMATLAAFTWPVTAASQ